MGHSQRLKLAEVHQVHRLVRELCELGDDPIVWRQHLMAQMCRITGASSAVAFVAALDSRPENMGLGLTVYHDTDSHFQKYAGHRDLSPDPCSQWIIPRLAHGFTADRREICDDRVYYRSDHFDQIMRPSDIDQYVLSIVALPDQGVCNAISLARGVNEDAFSGGTLKLLKLLHCELELLWRTPGLQLRNQERDRIDALPAQLQRILRFLQRGLSEKEVARAMGLRPATVHNYIVRLHQKLNVNSRSELLLKTASQRSYRPRLLPVS